MIGNESRTHRLLKQLIQVGARGYLLNALGILAITLSVFGHTSAAAVSAVVTALLALYFGRILKPWTLHFRKAVVGKSAKGVIGSYTLSRTLLAVALGVSALWENGMTALQWAPAVFLALMVMLEPVIRALTNVSGPLVVNAPWARTPQQPPFGTAIIFLLNTLGIIVAMAFIVLDLEPALALAFPLFSLGLAPILVMHARSRVQFNRGIKKNLTSDLTEYAPKFLLYWDAAVGTTFQVAMWLPYLDRLGERYIVVLRNERNVEHVAPLTDAPIVVCGAMTELDAIVVPSLRTAFYVNNAMRNCHFARYPQLTHIQLNHGDSDKAPSFNPVMRMYDRNFVAGQAAVDRFAANGIEVRDEFFTIVGRPQVADVRISDPQVPADTQQTVLYAPTWVGFMADSNYSSLPVGPRIITTLIEHGVRVVFRPHPHSRKIPALAAACDSIIMLLKADQEKTGTAHVYGQTAEVDMTIFDCFNASDAMVSDVSSVVPDYLYSEKPLALVAMNSTYDDFMAENPIATAAYVIDQELTNLEPILSDFLGADSMGTERRRVKGHYLGDFGDRDYGQVFIDEARRYL